MMVENFHQNKYKGMYKNVLKANPRATYQNPRKYFTTHQKSRQSISQQN